MSGALLRTVRGLAAPLLAVLVSMATLPRSAEAQVRERSEKTGPSVTLGSASASVGDQLGVTLRGFTSKIVTVQVCGNDGRRGSADCNLEDATTASIPDGRTNLRLDLTVSKPPAPCPCVVIAASDQFNEVAAAALDLKGHPKGPLTDPATAATPLQVSIDASRAQRGWWAAVRSGLGGKTEYAVTVVVKNPSGSPVSGAVLGISAERKNGEQVIDVPVSALSELAPQETWRTTVTAALPAPVYGTVVWRATITAQSISTTASVPTENRPTLLYVLLGIAVLCVALLLVRLAWRIGRAVAARTRRNSRVDAVDWPLDPSGTA